LSTAKLIVPRAERIALARRIATGSPALEGESEVGVVKGAASLSSHRWTQMHTDEGQRLFEPRMDTNLIKDWDCYRLLPELSTGTRFPFVFIAQSF
jgi:hypothetical protein